MSACLRRVLLVLSLCGIAFAAQAQVASPDVVRAIRAGAPARVLVMLREVPVSLKSVDQALREKAVAGKVDALIARMPRKGVVVQRRFALVPAVALRADAATLRRLAADPDVLRIDLDAPGKGHAPPDEASVLNRVGALPNLFIDGQGMKVAVIDSGVDTDHADLQARLVGQQCFCSNAGGSGGCCPNGQATQSGAGSAEDAHGHGTNVAGIIVGEGIVAPRGALPGAQLVAVKVLDANNNFCCSSDVIAAMDWVAAQHPDVDAVNLSLGTGALFSGHCDASTAFTQAMSASVNALIARGAVVTVSSGNQGNSNAMAAPACVQNAVSVGATWDFSGGARTFLGCSETSTEPMKPTCFTNRSATTDLYAAGAFVTSAGFTGTTSTFGGTSMAAPMVAACAVALKRLVPAMSVPQRMATMLRSQKRVTDPVSGRSYPFLDCTGALYAASKFRANATP